MVSSLSMKSTLVIIIIIILGIVIYYYYRNYLPPPPPPPHPIVKTLQLKFNGDQNSYAHIPAMAPTSLLPGYSYSIKFDVQTTARNGLLFHIGSSKGLSSVINSSITNDGILAYISVRIVNGDLVVLNGGSKGVVALKSVVPVPDGKRHSIAITRNGPAWLLKVDGNVAAIATTGTEKSDLLPAVDLYIGGSPNLNLPIICCISNIYINDNLKSQFYVVGNVSTKC